MKLAEHFIKSPIRGKNSVSPLCSFFYSQSIGVCFMLIFILKNFLINTTPKMIFQVKVANGQNLMFHSVTFQ